MMMRQLFLIIVAAVTFSSCGRADEAAHVLSGNSSPPIPGACNDPSGQCPYRELIGGGGEGGSALPPWAVQMSPTMMPAPLPPVPRCEDGWTVVTERAKDMCARELRVPTYGAK